MENLVRQWLKDNALKVAGRLLINVSGMFRRYWLESHESVPGLFKQHLSHGDARGAQEIQG